MSVGLLLPLGLLALVGLVVPLLIHLVRQSENPLIDFPALRWLRESVRPRRRLRFEDLWLLLARLLLVGLAAMLVALPVLEGSWRGARHWIAVVPGVDIDAARLKIVDAQAEWHWLASGFPAIDETPVADGASLSSLLRELDAELADNDTLSVVAADEVRGLDAQRIIVGRPIDWIVLPSATPGDVRPDPVEVTLALRHASSNDEGLRPIRAAVASWDAADGTHWKMDDQASSVPLPPKARALIWLGSPLPDSIEAWVRQGGRALLVDTATTGKVLWRDAQGVALAREERLGNGHLIHLRGPLRFAEFPALLDADFPTRLQALLRPAVPPPSRADTAQIKPRLSPHALPRFAPSTDLTPWIGLLIGLVFLIERSLAARRRQS